MSYEVCGEPDDTPPCQWCEETNSEMKDIKDAVEALCKEQMYDGGEMSKGVSVPFLMRMTLLRYECGLEVPQAVVDEAKAYFASIDAATRSTIDAAKNGDQP